VAAATKRAFYALVLAITVYSSFLLVACFLVRSDTRMQNVIYQNDFGLFLELLPFGFAALVIGWLLNSERTIAIFLAIFGANNRTSKAFAVAYWISVLAIYLSLFFNR